jgi:hypothetical protein
VRSRSGLGYEQNREGHMAYLMVSYRQPTTYSLVDLTVDELGMVEQGLNEMESLYQRLGAADDNGIIVAIRSLQTVMQRRFDSDDETEETDQEAAD